MAFIVLSFISSFLIIVYALYCRCSRRGRLFAKLPGPTRWPLVGNIRYFNLSQENLFNYMRTLPSSYGDVVGVGALNVTSIHIYHPDDIEIILSSTKFNSKNKPYAFLKRWLGEGLLLSNGNKWQSRRKLLTQAFHFNILKKYSKTFTEDAEELLKIVDEQFKNKKTNIVTLITKSTLKTICKTAMGTSMKEDIGSVTEKYFRAIKKIASAIVPRLCEILLFLDSSYRLSKNYQIEKDALKDLHAFTDTIIKERKLFLKKYPEILNVDNEEHDTSKKGRLAMLDLLIQNQDEGYIDDNGIREEVDTFMFRGFDTTSVALIHLIILLANETKSQNKVYKEMVSIFGTSDRNATMEDLKEMKYLECCIKETLRLYPSVHYIAREISEEIVLVAFAPEDKVRALMDAREGLAIAECPAYVNQGVIPQEVIQYQRIRLCQIEIFDLHRRPDFFPDPEKFIPERFLPENSLDRHPFAFIPFSAGPRNCIGQKFAMLEIKTFISRLIRKYQFEPVTKASDLKFYVDFVLKTSHPIYVRFRPRMIK